MPDLWSLSQRSLRLHFYDFVFDPFSPLLLRLDKFYLSIFKFTDSFLFHLFFAIQPIQQVFYLITFIFSSKISILELYSWVFKPSNFKQYPEYFKYYDIILWVFFKSFGVCYFCFSMQNRPVRFRPQIPVCRLWAQAPTSVQFSKPLLCSLDLSQICNTQWSVSDLAVFCQFHS